MRKEKRIVVTGIGPVTSIGIGRAELWDNLLAAKTHMVEEEFFVNGKRWDSYHYHKIENFDLSGFGLDNGALDWIKDWKSGDEIIDLSYMLAAVKLALDDSGIEYNPEKESDFGLVVTHENMNLVPFLSKISMRSFDILTDKNNTVDRETFYEKIYHDCLKVAYDTQPFMTLFHVGKVFNVRKHSLFICNACASGLYALETASEMIKNGHASLVVITASDHSDFYKYLWFKELGVYSQDGIIRPFSKDSNGLAFGDAGIALVLEELESARLRNAPIYAEYMGGGFSLEGWQVTVPKVGSNSYYNAMLKAFEQSGVSKESVDLICPHGVGSRIIDYYESKAITDMFGQNSRRPLVTVFKPYVGHTLGASALLETAILLLSFKNETVLPALHSENMHPDYRFSLVRQNEKVKLNKVMKICTAFAGYNAAAIFARLTS